MATHRVSVNYYSVLGVARDASVKEINIAFKRLALKLHPDKSGGDRASIEQFHRTQEAAETLRDPERRRRHDESLVDSPFTVNPKGEGRPSHYKARKSTDKHDASEWNNESGQSPPKQQYDNHRDMWGPYIYAYNTTPPRPNFKMPKVEKQSKSPVADDNQSKLPSAGIDPEAQKAYTEPPEDEMRNRMMPDQEDMKTVEKEMAEGCDTEFDELLDEDDSIFHDTIEYDSMAGSFHEDHCSSPLHSWVASGYGESSEDGGVPLLDEHQREDDDTMHTMYYDCSDFPEHVSLDGPSSPTEEEDTDDESEVADEQPNIEGALRPFVPYLKDKLRDSGGRYTPDDLCTELNGLVLEAYSGWLEHQRTSFTNAKASTAPGNPQDCAHLGLWKKDFNHPECEICHLWKPVYVLTCPGCEAKACVRCKFSDSERSTGGIVE